MTLDIDIQNEPGYPIDEQALRQAAQVTLAAFDLHPQASVTIALLTDAAMRALNRRYRGLDQPTDVLSFQAEPLPDEIDEAPHLGDILIAYDYVRAQSEREGYPLDQSLTLMVVHGLLHLLGYDHETPPQRQAMWDIQGKLLRRLGIQPDIVLAYEQEHDDSTD